MYIKKFLHHSLSGTPLRNYAAMFWSNELTGKVNASMPKPGFYVFHFLSFAPREMNSWEDSQKIDGRGDFGTKSLVCMNLSRGGSNV